MATDQQEIAEALSEFLRTMNASTSEPKTARAAVCFTFSSATVKDGTVAVMASNAINVNGTVYTGFNEARRELVLHCL